MKKKLGVVFSLLVFSLLLVAGIIAGFTWLYLYFLDKEQNASLSEESLSQKSVELGEFMGKEFPELKIRQVLIAAKINTETDRVGFVAYLFQEGSPDKPFAIIVGSEAKNAKGAFEALLQEVRKKFSRANARLFILPQTK